MNMLKNIGGDLAGTSDNCVPVSREHWSEAGDLLTFVGPREKPWIILKSKVKEFIFTDLAFIYIERDNVAGWMIYFIVYMYPLYLTLSSFAF